MSPGAPPRVEGHDAVVEDVEEGEVGVLLLEEEDGRVRHVQDLGGVEHPGHAQRPHRRGGARVVHGLAAPAVVATHVETGEQPSLILSTPGVLDISTLSI